MRNKISNGVKLAVSHIAWPTELDEQVWPLLSQTGVSALELAPTKIWPDIFQAKREEAEEYIKKISRYGLKVAGFHALLYGMGHLSIFGSPEIQKQTQEYLLQLAKICHWLGGKILVFGSPQCRKRGEMSPEESLISASTFFRKLIDQCEDYDVCFVIEPLGESEADFITSAKSALDLIKKVNHPKFQGHLDAKALAEAGEIKQEVFEEFKPYLKHFHVNDPGLAVLDENDKIGHQKIAEFLKQIDYRGYASLEQRPDKEKPIESCLHSLEVMKKYYAN